MDKQLYTIIEFLIENNSRITCDGRWLVAEKNKGEDVLYTVYEHQRRKTITLYAGYYLSTALRMLKGDAT